MYGAIIGDIVGSVYEFVGMKSKEFPLISGHSSFTDDSIMTVAVASALVRSATEGKPFKETVVEEMRAFGQKYPYPDGGYGGRFGSWLCVKDPAPYNSFGNGSAMRVSPCGLIAVSIEETLALARASAEVTHNHPYGIEGAEATAAAVFLAKSGGSKEDIKKYIEDNFYILNETLDEIRPKYEFDETCQGTVPPAIEAFLESTDYEDAIRNAVSLGGDADTLAAITGSIAWAYYYHGKTDDEEKTKKFIRRYNIDSLLPDDFRSVILDFEELCQQRESEYKTKGKIENFTVPLSEK